MRTVSLKDMIRVNFKFFFRQAFNMLECFTCNNWFYNFERNFLLANFLQSLKNIVATLLLQPLGGRQEGFHLEDCQPS